MSTLTEAAAYLRTQESKDCLSCDNGIFPQRVIRMGRASFCCSDCRRDVSMAVFLMDDVGLNVTEVKP